MKSTEALNALQAPVKPHHTKWKLTSKKKRWLYTLYVPASAARERLVSLSVPYSVEVITTWTDGNSKMVHARVTLHCDDRDVIADGISGCEPRQNVEEHQRWKGALSAAVKHALNQWGYAAETVSISTWTEPDAAPAPWAGTRQQPRRQTKPSQAEEHPKAEQNIEPNPWNEIANAATPAATPEADPITGELPDAPAGPITSTQYWLTVQKLGIPKVEGIKYVNANNGDMRAALDALLASRTK